jgi:hypothetical protein
LPALSEAEVEAVIAKLLLKLEQVVYQWWVVWLASAQLGGTAEGTISSLVKI